MCRYPVSERVNPGFECVDIPSVRESIHLLVVCTTDCDDYCSWTQSCIIKLHCRQIWEFSSKLENILLMFYYYCVNAGAGGLHMDHGPLESVQSITLRESFYALYCPKLIIKH